VALARALIHQPRLLLLDEPLGALDALTRIEMQQLIERLWRQHGFTVLLVTHDVSEAVAVADRVILIEDGEVGLDLLSTCRAPGAWFAPPGRAGKRSAQPCSVRPGTRPSRNL
jgi:sulfonate transport system ATP-binding protein